MPSRLVAAAVVLTLLGWTGSAAAQVEGEGMSQLEAQTLELGVMKARVADQLQAGDCAAACEALASMERAAERICDLEPGPRCEEAKRDVDEARQRVDAACPDCAQARRDGSEVRTYDERPEPGRDEVDEEGADEDAPPEPRTVATGVSASAPPAEDSRGGCAACAIGEGGGAGDDALGLLGLGAALWVARRRRRS